MSLRNKIAIEYTSPHTKSIKVKDLSSARQHFTRRATVSIKYSESIPKVKLLKTPVFDHTTYNKHITHRVYDLNFYYKSCILFKIMYDNVLIFLQKPFTRYRYSRPGSCGICGNVFVMIINTEIQKNTSISSQWHLLTVKTVVSANRRNSRGS